MNLGRRLAASNTCPVRTGACYELGGVGGKSTCKLTCLKDQIERGTLGEWGIQKEGRAKMIPDVDFQLSAGTYVSTRDDTKQYLTSLTHCNLVQQYRKGYIISCYAKEAFAS